MKWFLKLGSYLFHPLWMPFIGSFFYFYITPRYIDIYIIKAQLLAIGIVTMLIPIIYFFMLKNMGLAQSIFLKNIKERRLPLLFFVILLLLLMNVIINRIDVPELYYFFGGILIASITNFLLALLKIKVSLHMVGVSGLAMFTIALSIHYNINLLAIISALVIINGWVASSRLYAKAHTVVEVILGIAIGFLPQLFLLKFWL
ncbi:MULTISPECIES: hypothetical protein [Croceibacter]|uniref:hypothetical protein n=1 Tax=Croceibacter TaxID=216431 RepID=UPI000C5C4070|nr:MULTISPECIES: hypothetical protein [Croceibacter]MBG26101.1 hypothetical protein [Croceibacter sp.]|tara:strand:+ start:9067 stop:9672 length:606 start_codon:yes stop_codon:yes gene_type:complete